MKLNNFTSKIYISLIIAGLFIFLLASFGVFDGLSAKISVWLFNTFGYTNRWSRSYGPQWFVHLNSNISSFGSKEMVIIFSFLFFCFLILNDNKKEAFGFLITIASGLLVIFLMKYITSEKELTSITELYTDTLSRYPSGHTFIATVLYLTIALILSRHSGMKTLKHYYFISAAVIIFLVGISRVTGSGHTLTEVIASWSSGTAWFSVCALIFATGKFKHQ